jgi:hypothetical protein
VYTNPHNVILTLMELLDTNEQQINRTVRVYQGKRSLTVLEGLRQSLPARAYPSFEIEPGSGANRWATTRAQRPRFTFTCTLTVSNGREKYGVDYVATLATTLAEIMTSPDNLQMRILNETKWDPHGGLKDTYMLDSLVEDISYGAARDGTMRTAEFSWFVEVHEPFPDSKWLVGGGNTPSVLRPGVVEV